MKTRLACVSFVFLASACGQPESEPAAEAMAPAPPQASTYAAAMANPSRPDADRARDAGRRPAEVLQFFDIRPGAAVLDMFSGGGYYTEMLSRVVGDGGHVTSHTNKVMQSFSGDEYNARLADNRLANVEVLTAENNELELAADQYDAVIMTLNYHDLYWVSGEYGWEKIDVEKILAELYKALRPGGTFGIVDHYAETGSPRETGGSLHRIDPGIVIADMEAAGFVLAGKNDLLRNMDDDHSKSVFDPEIRGKTDRFMLRFKKPE
ncbi:MAG: methyltransferase domain-containing protein [Gammaproteobacteria bacterium]|nr:methyltransferase domain-containing protein [Gammaproteobacteria bacterium]MDH3429307.1 methyltransferase domain-containing protein [Gammaproteobacteria bacterium]